MNKPILVFLKFPNPFLNISCLNYSCINSNKLTQFLVTFRQELLPCSKFEVAYIGYSPRPRYVAMLRRRLQVNTGYLFMSR